MFDSRDFQRFDFGRRVCAEELLILCIIGCVKSGLARFENWKALILEDLLPVLVLLPQVHV